MARAAPRREVLAMPISDVLSLALLVYTGVGVLFGSAFVAVGASRIDGGARGAPLAFRLLIFPGAAALWPLLLRKWLTAPRGPHP
jgi:hypothetical protein